MKFAVMTPFDNQDNLTSGGGKTLIKLVRDLNAIGANAYLSTPSDVVRDADIAIYPEGTVGNPLSAKVCIKWLLYHQPHTITYGKDEYVFKFLEYYTCYQPDQILGKLKIFDFSDYQWYDQNKTRKGVCYAIRKGRNKWTHGLKQLLEDATCIDEYTSNDFLFEAFNSYEEFISIDSRTALSIQAAMCGCNSVVVPDEGVSKAQWIEMDTSYKYGIAYGFEDCEHSRSTRHLIHDAMLAERDKALFEVKAFINICHLLLKNR